jgi:hypothetical protein
MPQSSNETVKEAFRAAFRPVSIAPQTPTLFPKNQNA